MRSDLEIAPGNGTAVLLAVTRCHLLCHRRPVDDRRSTTIASLLWQRQRHLTLRFYIDRITDRTATGIKGSQRQSNHPLVVLFRCKLRPQAIFEPRTPHLEIFAKNLCATLASAWSVPVYHAIAYLFPDAALGRRPWHVAIRGVAGLPARRRACAH